MKDKLFTRALLATAALFFVAALCAGCAKVNPALVAADDAVTARLTSATGKLRGICTNPQLAAPCKDVLPLASKSLGVAIEYNRAIAKQEPFKLAALIVSIGELIEGVMQLPQGETAGLIDDLAAAIAAARVGGE